jgi:hypothetical protein
MKKWVATELALHGATLLARENGVACGWCVNLDCA